MLGDNKVTEHKNGELGKFDVGICKIYDRHHIIHTSNRSIPNETTKFVIRTLDWENSSYTVYNDEKPEHTAPVVSLAVGWERYLSGSEDRTVSKE